MGKGREASSLDEFRFDGNVHRIADQDSPGFERGVPGETEVLAVDLGRGLQANADISPRVLLRRGGAFDGEGDRPSDAVDGEVAGYRVFVFSLALHLSGFER
jgi:hypothetical protein